MNYDSEQWLKKSIFLKYTHALSIGMTYQLEEPFFEDKGKITAQKEIGHNQTQMTFSSNGTFKGNIEVTNSGDLVSMSKGNKGTSAQGQGVVTTKDGSEKANYTFLQVGKTTTKDGKPVLRGVGSAVWYRLYWQVSIS